MFRIELMQKIIILSALTIKNSLGGNNYSTRIIILYYKWWVVFIDIRDKLRVWREDNVRQSNEIITMWDTVLQDKINKLGDESKL